MRILGIAFADESKLSLSELWLCVNMPGVKHHGLAVNRMVNTASTLTLFSAHGIGRRLAVCKVFSHVNRCFSRLNKWRCAHDTASSFLQGLCNLQMLLKLS